MKIKVLQLKDEMDGSGDVMSTNATVEFNSRVSLVKDFSLKKTIGYADLIREDNNFFITNIQPIVLTKLSGELLSKDEFIEMIKLAVPAVGGKILKRTANVIEHFSISMISLNTSLNSDPEIRSIEGQLLYEQ